MTASCVVRRLKALRGRITLAAIALLSTSLLALAAPATAHADGRPVRIDRQATFDGADTYMFSIRIDEATDGDHFNIANGSFFHVKGWYVDGNGSGQPTQHAAGMRGVIQYHTGLDCPPESDNVDPCFMDIAGVSKKDLSETRIHTGQDGGFVFETDPNSWAWGSAEGEIVWDQARRFDVPAGADQLTVRFIMTIPGADQIDVDLHIHSPHDISIRDTLVTNQGFAHSTNDFEPATHVDTWAAEAMTGGQKTVNVPSGDRLYAGFGPSWFGDSQTFTGTGLHNTASVSDLHVEEPDGDETGGIAVAAGGAPQILVPGSTQDGDWRFEIQKHAGVGPQDVYLVGHKGPVVD